MIGKIELAMSEIVVSSLHAVTVSLLPLYPFSSETCALFYTSHRHSLQCEGAAFQVILNDAQDKYLAMNSFSSFLKDCPGSSNRLKIRS